MTRSLKLVTGELMDEEEFTDTVRDLQRLFRFVALRGQDKEHPMAEGSLIRHLSDGAIFGDAIRLVPAGESCVCCRVISWAGKGGVPSPSEIEDAMAAYGLYGRRPVEGLPYRYEHVALVASDGLAYTAGDPNEAYLVEPLVCRRVQ